MTYKAVALFDLDKTLLNPEKQIPEENLAALAALHENHVLPVISTGRNYYELKDWMQAGQITSAIAANGADLFVNGTHVFQSTIGTPQLARLTARANLDGLALAYYNDHSAALSQETALTQANYQWVRQTPPPVNADFYQQQAVCMLLIFLAHDEKGDAIAQQYIEAFPELTFYRNSDNTLDIVNAGQSKATGLQLLMQQPELSGLPTYAFGDGNNDIAILKAADYGIAMGNALPNVKAIADHVSTDYREGGVVNGLKHYGLI